MCDAGAVTMDGGRRRWQIRGHRYVDRGDTRKAGGETEHSGSRAWWQGDRWRRDRRRRGRRRRQRLAVGRIAAPHGIPSLVVVVMSVAAVAVLAAFVVRVAIHG